MSYTLENQLRVDIRIGTEQREIQLALGPSILQALTIIENTHFILPTVQCRLLDISAGQDSSGIFADGVVMRVELGPDSDTEALRYHPFRLFSVPKHDSTSAGNVYSLTGVLNVPTLFKTMVNKSYKGSSSSVLQQIAQDNSLKFDTDPSSDSQVWLPNGLSLGQFCHRIARHGWSDVESLMQFCITGRPSGEKINPNEIPYRLRYKNVTKQIKEPAVATLVNYQVKQPGSSNVPTLFCMDYRTASRSGVMNHYRGYNSRVGQSGVSGSYLEPNQVSVLRSTQKLDMGKALKEAIGLTRREFLPFDCGNTHPNYAVAYNQNGRLASTYANTLYVLLPDYSGLSLLDPVDVSFLSYQTMEANRVLSGRYIVSAKATHIAGPYYREKIELVNQGVNQDNLQERV